MTARIKDRHSGLHARPIPSPLIVVIATWSLTASAQSPLPAKSTTTPSEPLLPRNVVVPLSVVNRFFPEITREITTGQNLPAVGNPKATRSVIYANGDSSKKVTISVDQYGTSSDAWSAYQEAAAKSKRVPGFKPVSAANPGKNAFVGSVTQGGETHIGLGALHGTLIVGATLAGYNPTPDKLANLISLTREEEGAAKAILDANLKK